MITPRIKNAAGANPEVYRGLLALSNAAAKLGVPRTTLLMVSLRASQINGCSFCVDMHWRELREEGESDEKIFAISAWPTNKSRGWSSIGPTATNWTWCRNW